MEQKIQILWTLNKDNEVILTRFSVEGEDVIYTNADSGEPVLNITQMREYLVKPDPPITESMHYLDAIKILKMTAVKRQDFEIAWHIRDFEKKISKIIEANESR